MLVSKSQRFLETLSGGADIDEQPIPLPPGISQNKNTNKNNGNNNSLKVAESNRLVFATWNVLTAKDDLKRSKINDFLLAKNIDFCSIQETHMRGSGEIELEDYFLLFSGRNDVSREGVGIVLKKKYRSLLKDTSVSKEFPGRFLALHFPGFSVVSVYNFTECSHETALKDKFADEVSLFLERLPGRHPVFIGGDLNARIGRDRDSTIGPHPTWTEESANDNGNRYREVAAKNELVFAATWFRKKQAKKVTWYSRLGRRINYSAALDHILVPKRFLYMLTDCRTVQHPPSLSDHRPLVASIRWRFPNFRKRTSSLNNKNIDWSTSTLDTLDKLISPVSTTDFFDVDKAWSSLKSEVITALPKLPVAATIGSRGAASGSDQEKWWRSRAENIETEFKKNNLQSAFKLINSVFSPVRSLPSDPDSVANALASHHESPPDKPDFVLHTVANEVQGDSLPSLEKVMNACRRLKRAKSCGPDNIPGEVWRSVSCQKRLHSLVSTIWTHRKMPSEWRHSNVVPLSKPGGGFRGISLTCTAYKVYALLLLDEIFPNLEDILPDSQYAYRPGRSTADAIGIVQQIIEKHREYNIPLDVVLVDFKKAFDRADRKAICAILTDAGVDWRTVDRIRDLMDQVSFSVKGRDFASAVKEILNGIRQGCPLSPVLFLLLMGFMNKIVSASLQNLSIWQVEYADDKVIAGSSALEALKICKDVGPSLGLEVNEDKTVTFEALGPRDSFKYLGSVVGDSKKAVSLRLARAWTSFHRLQAKLWKQSNISVSTKMQVFKAVCISTLMYGLELLPISAAQSRPLDYFAYRCLRRFFKYEYKDNVSYTTLSTRCANLGIDFDWPSSLLKQRRIRGYGHFVRHHPEIVSLKPAAKRPIGRPRLRLFEIVKKDIGYQQLTQEDLQLFASDRELWSGMAFEAT